MRALRLHYPFGVSPPADQGTADVSRGEHHPEAAHMTERSVRILLPPSHRGSDEFETGRSRPSPRAVPSVAPSPRRPMPTERSLVSLTERTDSPEPEYPPPRIVYEAIIAKDRAEIMELQEAATSREAELQTDIFALRQKLSSARAQASTSTSNLATTLELTMSQLEGSLATARDEHNMVLQLEEHVRSGEREYAALHSAFKELMRDQNELQAQLLDAQQALGHMHTGREDLLRDNSHLRQLLATAQEACIAVKAELTASHRSAVAVAHEVELRRHTAEVDHQLRNAEAVARAVGEERDDCLLQLKKERAAAAVLTHKLQAYQKDADVARSIPHAARGRSVEPRTRTFQRRGSTGTLTAASGLALPASAAVRAHSIDPSMLRLPATAREEADNDWDTARSGANTRRQQESFRSRVSQHAASVVSSEMYTERFLPDVTPQDTRAGVRSFSPASTSPLDRGRKGVGRSTSPSKLAPVVTGGTGPAPRLAVSAVVYRRAFNGGNSNPGAGSTGNSAGIVVGQSSSVGRARSTSPSITRNGIFESPSTLRGGTSPSIKRKGAQGWRLASPLPATAHQGSSREFRSPDKAAARRVHVAPSQPREAGSADGDASVTSEYAEAAGLIASLSRVLRQREKRERTHQHLRLCWLRWRTLAQWGRAQAEKSKLREALSSSVDAIHATQQRSIDAIRAMRRECNSGNQRLVQATRHASDVAAFHANRATFLEQEVVALRDSEALLSHSFSARTRTTSGTGLLSVPIPVLSGQVMHAAALQASGNSLTSPRSDAGVVWQPAPEAMSRSPSRGLVSIPQGTGISMVRASVPVSPAPSPTRQRMDAVPGSRVPANAGTIVPMCIQESSSSVATPLKRVMDFSATLASLNQDMDTVTKHLMDRESNRKGLWHSSDSSATPHESINAGAGTMPSAC